MSRGQPIVEFDGVQKRYDGVIQQLAFLLELDERPENSCGAGVIAADVMKDRKTVGLRRLSRGGTIKIEACCKPFTAAHLTNALPSSNAFWGEHDSKLNERFNTWFAQ
ncbi:MAG: hypothetical protein ABI459_02635 [Deltaproteobacteria bacterium]